MFFVSWIFFVWIFLHHIISQLSWNTTYWIRKQLIGWCTGQTRKITDYFKTVPWGVLGSLSLWRWSFWLWGWLRGGGRGGGGRGGGGRGGGRWVPFLFALFIEEGLWCCLVKNLVTNLSPYLMTNLVITKIDDNFVTQFGDIFYVHQIWWQTHTIYH